MKKKSRAIFYIDKKLVLIRREKENDIYFVFPGGSVEVGESFEQAVIRELKEELGITASISKILFEIIDHENKIHETFFEIKIESGSIGTGFDKKFINGTQESLDYEIVMFSKEELGALKILPSTIKDKILTRQESFI